MNEETPQEAPEETGKKELLDYAPPFPLSPKRIAETSRMGARNLRRYKLRSFLTTLGIVFGVGAVVSMMSVAAGASRELLDRIHKLGTRNIILKSVRPPEQREARGQRSWVKAYGLRERDVRVMEGAVPGIRTSVRAHRILKKVFLGSRQVDPAVLGVEPAYFDALNLEVERGRAIHTIDEQSLACVCVVGPALFSALGGTGDPIGQGIRIGNQAFTICGLLTGEKTGSEAMNVYIPYQTAVRRFGLLQARIGSGTMEASKVEVGEIVLRCIDHESVLPAASVVEHVMRRLHDSLDYEITVPLRLLEQAERTQRVFQIVMVLIAGISLVVGGIGIANIMFASVMERTREIGIRRALGARKADILTQFLVETVVIALIGGLCGCLVGVIGSLTIAHFTEWPVHMTPGPFVLALAISCAVGILSGLAPARRASLLDPVAALWHD
ncbi:MAG: ABC transporter permease [Planctomycetota bacterium]